MTQLNALTEKLVELDENQLFLQLGMSTKEISKDLEGQTRSASIDSVDLVIHDITRGNEDTLSLVCHSGQSMKFGKSPSSLTT